MAKIHLKLLLFNFSQSPRYSEGQNKTLHMKSENLNYNGHQLGLNKKGLNLFNVSKFFADSELEKGQTFVYNRKLDSDFEKSQSSDSHSRC